MVFQHPPASSHPGVLHYIPPNLSAFEPTKTLVRSLNINTLIWVGGLSDTPCSVSYPFTLAQALPPTWSLIAASLGSSGLSWGVKSIAEDAADMGKIVAYTKERYPGGKVVIMGHSTGCQDCMEYLVGKHADKRPEVDGVILQAPVSDREALAMDLPQARKDEADQMALKICREGKGKDALPVRLTLPIFGTVAISAKRWTDVSCPSGADDYFSSDLPLGTLEDTFGKLPKRVSLLILFSGADDSVPESVDKNKLVQRWFNVVKQSGGNVDDLNGGVVSGASHNLNGDPEPVVQDLVKRVLGFVGGMDASSST